MCIYIKRFYSSLAHMIIKSVNFVAQEDIKTMFLKYVFVQVFFFIFQIIFHIRYILVYSLIHFLGVLGTLELNTAFMSKCFNATVCVATSANLRVMERWWWRRFRIMTNVPCRCSVNSARHRRLRQIMDDSKMIRSTHHLRQI